MAYLRIYCGNCGMRWEVYQRDDWNSPEAATCPHCGKQIDGQTWHNLVVPAFGAVADANAQLFKDADGYNLPEFSFDVMDDHVFRRKKSFRPRG